ncbi:ribonuclease HI [Tunicatimonas pelagia]|uniref:ribonuclease HI n=1 Tax=Tunicatimonas pelagia TaxID=931531 RepID=UPI0026655024|nr:ribonuclease HI [Tunicatimonas pelagia]WKN43686.1 ribonuclease HI [Tunicatimonas pelagia]
MVTIYTDGSSRGNPGRGGYGTVMLYKGHRKELSEGYRLTTNNRMELLAVIMGLEALKKGGTVVEVYSDSQYVVDAVNKGWVWNWQKKDFKGKKNADLWKRFIPAYRKHDVTLKWIKGHSGIPENERCDELAVGSADGNSLRVDKGFEASITHGKQTTSGK